MDSILDRLKKLKENNPDLHQLLDENFPEVRDTVPFVESGSLFLREQYPHNIYVVLFKRDRFFVKNIKDDENWGSHIEATNVKELSRFNRAVPFLSRFDFNKLLKLSGTNVNKVSLVTGKDVLIIHKNKFNNEV